MPKLVFQQRRNRCFSNEEIGVLATFLQLFNMCPPIVLKHMYMGFLLR